MKGVTQNTLMNYIRATSSFTKPILIIIKYLGEKNVSSLSIFSWSFSTKKWTFIHDSHHLQVYDALLLIFFPFWLPICCFLLSASSLTIMSAENWGEMTFKNTHHYTCHHLGCWLVLLVQDHNYLASCLWVLENPFQRFSSVYTLHSVLKFLSNKESIF